MGYLIANPSFKITFWFRIGTWLKQKHGIGKVLYWVVFMIHKHNIYKTGIQLPIGTQIGGGLNFSHFSGIVINSGAVIGKNCTIFQCVTIGSTRGKGVATIGNNVMICSGAKIISCGTIGDNVVIGANAVVTGDIPSESVAVGIPARVVNQDAWKLLRLYLPAGTYDNR